MTQKRIDLAEEVRILELEVRKLELENRITQLKAEPSIDEECVGCCKVVDIAAGLQKELDACHSTIKDFKAIETRETDRLHKTISDQLRTIHYLKQEIVGRKDQLMEQRERTEFREREVHRLKEKLVEHTDTIEELKDRNIEDLHELYDIYEEEIDLLNAELSARKHDSEVLKKVIEIVKNWDDSTGRAFPSMYKILDLLVDYTDVHEEPEDTTIDETQKITVKVLSGTDKSFKLAFLELP